MNHFTKLSLILVVALLGSQPALARHHRPELKEHGEGGGPGGELQAALQALNLTDEQKNKIKELRKASGEANKETRNALKEGRKALEEAMGDAKKADLLAKFDSLAGLRAKLSRARFEMMLSVREILTPEQRQKFRSFMESHKGKRFGKSKDTEQED